MHFKHEKNITLNIKILREILKFFTWKKDTIFFKINKKYEIFLKNIKICISNRQNFDEFYFNVKSASDFASVKCDICKLFDLKKISSIKLSQKNYIFEDIFLRELFHVISVSYVASVNCNICKLFYLKNVSSLKLSQMS